jgi:hypothetical protein
MERQVQNLRRAFLPSQHHQEFYKVLRVFVDDMVYNLLDPAELQRA